MSVCLIRFFASLQQFFSYIGTGLFLSPKLGLMFLLKDTPQWRRLGSYPRPFGLDSSTLPLSHCTPLLMAFRWRAEDGPFLVLFWSSLPSQKEKKTLSELAPLWQNFLCPTDMHLCCSHGLRPRFLAVLPLSFMYNYTEKANLTWIERLYRKTGWLVIRHLLFFACTIRKGCDEPSLVACDISSKISLPCPDEL